MNTHETGSMSGLAYLTPQVLDTMAVNIAGGSVTVGLWNQGRVTPRALAEVSDEFVIQAREMTAEARRLGTNESVLRLAPSFDSRPPAPTDRQRFSLLWRMERSSGLHACQVFDIDSYGVTYDNAVGSEVEITETDGKLHVSVSHRGRRSQIHQHETATPTDSESLTPDISSVTVIMVDSAFFDLVHPTLGKTDFDFGSSPHGAIYTTLLLSARIYASNEEYYDEGFKLESVDGTKSILVYIDPEKNTITLDNRQRVISFDLNKPKMWQLPDDFEIDASNFVLRSEREIQDDGYAFFLKRTPARFTFQETRLVNDERITLVQDEDGLDTISPAMTEILAAEKAKMDAVVSRVTSENLDDSGSED